VIAVVDDQESVRKAIVRLLQAAGHTARGYASGHEFLENWLVDRPDCLLLDLQMPGLSGMDVHRALNQAKAHIPVVVITAHDSPVARQECIHAGAVAYLCKPPDERVLLDAVRLALANGIAASTIAETKAIAEEGFTYGLPLVMY
jgi:FixJ family two-component response regulator